MPIDRIKLPDNTLEPLRDSTKQEILVSGTNIKTINNESLLGSGNITINADTSACELLANKVTAVTSSSTDTEYPSAKSVYDAMHPKTGASQPAGGMLPNMHYKLGTLSGSVTFSLATPEDPDIDNYYFWSFSTGGTAPTVTWPSSVTKWYDGSSPTINASKYYEVIVIDGVGSCKEI